MKTEHTPGPWSWYGSTERGCQRIQLATQKHGRLTVMDFVRLGMQRAQPRFAIRSDKMGGLMHESLEFAKVDHSQEIIDMDHPDARLIAAAPDLLAALEAQKIGECFCEAGINNPMFKGHAKSCDMARAAIAKYRGES